MSPCSQTQADGPHHWLANKRAPTGETLGRRRLLAARGWAVVSVPYFDWPSGGARDKQAYMRAVRCLLCTTTHWLVLDLCWVQGALRHKVAAASLLCCYGQHKTLLQVLQPGYEVLPLPAPR